MLAAGGKPEGEGWEGLGMEPAPEGFGTVRRLELRQERTTSINGVVRRRCMPQGGWGAVPAAAPPAPRAEATQPPPLCSCRSAPSPAGRPPRPPRRVPPAPRPAGLPGPPDAGGRASGCLGWLLGTPLRLQVGGCPLPSPLLIPVRPADPPRLQAGLGIDDPCDPAALRLAWPLCVVLARDPASLRPASPGSAPRPGTPAPA